MKIAFYTLGCKVNQYETQALKERFISLGYQIVDEHDSANVYVINTCTVTNLADRKSRQYIRRMKRLNPESIIAVIGCYAQINIEAIKEMKEVDIIAGNNEKNHLPEYVENYIAYGGRDKTPVCHLKPYKELTDYEETGTITSMESRSRAYIKVQEGCNQFCSYCIIPYARGKIRSRSLENIILEAQNLINKGFQELVITGINTALYGMERFPNGKPAQGHGIEKVIKALNGLPGDFRIRLGSLEPTVIDVNYAKHLLQYEKLCPHMHLSLQSGSNKILNRMNRHYSREDYVEIIKELRDFDNGYGITTDIIVGFPGETDKDFRDSVEIIKEVRFNDVHIFPYSKREGTVACKMSGQISTENKKSRVEEIQQAAKDATRKYLETNIDTVRQVIFENYDQESKYLSGFTENYIKFYSKIEEGIEIESFLNTFHKVKLSSLYKDGVMGEVLKKGF